MEPAEQAKETKDREVPFSAWIPFIAGATCGVAIRLLFSGKPGGLYAAMTGAFIYLAPILVGMVTVYAAERRQRRSWRYYFSAGAVTNLLFVGPAS